MKAGRFNQIPRRLIRRLRAALPPEEISHFPISNQVKVHSGNLNPGQIHADIGLFSI
jgi:hypothetical protein